MGTPQRYPNESNEQLIVRKEIEDAIHGLMAVVSKNHLCVVGHVWGSSPAVFVQFKNCAEVGADLTALLLKLGTMSEDKEERGMVMNVRFHSDS